MPEVNLNMGDRITQRVRQFFQKGHKSGNKLYAVKINGEDDQPLWNTIQLKAETRDWHAGAARDLRPAWPGSNCALAQDLVRVPIEDRSGNCQEQAALAAWHLLKSEFLPRNRIHIVSITHPGDHVFCLVSGVPIPETARNFASVSQFVQARVAPS